MTIRELANAIEDMHGCQSDLAVLAEAAEALRSAQSAPKTIRIRFSCPDAPRPFTEWFEGVVTDVGEDSFWADLQDVRHPKYPIEVVEMALSNVEDEKRKFVREGAVFYLTATSEQWIIEFKEDVWTESQISECKEKAAK